MLEINMQNFDQEVMNADKPVLIDFWAAWCGPCRMVKPILEEMAEEHKEKIKIVACDVDNNRELAEKFQVSSIPTIILFKDGSEVEKQIGALPKASLEKMILDYL